MSQTPTHQDIDSSITPILKDMSDRGLRLNREKLGWIGCFHKDGKLALQATQILEKAPHQEGDLQVFPLYRIYPINGRIISSSPNVASWKSEVWDCILPEPGPLLFAVSYRTLELMVLFKLAEDEANLALLRTGQDFHKITAAALFSKPLSEVTKDQRQIAKMATFLGYYSGHANHLTRNIMIGRVEARKIMARWRRHFSLVTALAADMKAVAYEEGLSYSHFGRPWKIEPEKLSQGIEPLGRVVQTTSAEVVSLALSTLVTRFGTWLTPISVRFDEILISVSSQAPVSFKEEIVKALTHCEGFPDLPLPVEIESIPRKPHAV